MVVEVEKNVVRSAVEVLSFWRAAEVDGREAGNYRGDESDDDGREDYGACHGGGNNGLYG